MKKFFMCTNLFILGIGLYKNTAAQLSLNAQLRTRTEYRDGLGTLRPKANDPGFFTSQRTRLTFNYKSNRLILQTSLQDVRVWGQDASTINNADGIRLGLHEGWAEVILANRKDTSFKKQSVDYFAVKAGRQEIIYDDSRLLGNLDWLQQARRHDAVVFKLVEKGWQVDAGFAFNQNTDAFNYNGTYYMPANVMPYVKDNKGALYATPAGFIPLTVGGTTAGISSKTGAPALQIAPSTNGLYQDYKSFQYLYAAKSIKQTRITALLFSDRFGKYILDSVPTAADGQIYGRRFNQKGTNARITTGSMVISSLSKQLSLSAAFYYQFGKDRDAINVSAYTSTLALTFTKGKFAYTAGWDYLSGNDAFSASTTNHRFDPLYGTPHKFWGLMDYFYAGTGSPAGGLSNSYAKIKYTSINKRLTAGLDYHYFALANDQKDVAGNAINKYLGSEFDFVTNYALNKVTTIEWGLAFMAATKSMEYAKAINPGSSNLNNVWSYLSLNMKPEFLFK
jgi:hypothetical protein